MKWEVERDGDDQVIRGQVEEQLEVHGLLGHYPVGASLLGLSRDVTEPDVCFKSILYGGCL